MNIPAFDEKELKVVGEAFSLYGPIPIFDTPVSLCDGYLAALRDRKPLWQITGVETQMFTPSIIPDNVARALVIESEPFDALKNGADEIDMVINIGELKAGNYDYVLNEIKTLKKACGDNILKVIIETCLLTDEEKVKMCQLVTEAGADYIKTSTGFSKAGATFSDIALFAANIGADVKMKAAGGISSIEDAEEFVRLGASRLGTSRIVKIVKAQDDGSAY